MAHCGCSKSDAKMGVQCPPYLEEVATKMEDRRCDLLFRQKYLSDKVTTMERSIPALMAYNMWMADPNCDTAPLCKIQEIMKTFSPYGDPTEKLLEKLKSSAQELHGEAEQLHEKIISTEVELEETDMQLESLELANQEMNGTLESLEKEVRSYTSPSLHSIHSEDLSYLSKLRELAKEELKLKRYIKELETKEVVFSEQMDRLLTSIPSRPPKRIERKCEDVKKQKSSWIMSWWGGSKTPQPEYNESRQALRKQDDMESCVCQSLVVPASKKKSHRVVTQSKPMKSQKQSLQYRCVPLNVRNANGRMLCTCDLALMDDADFKKSSNKLKTPPCDVPSCFASDTVRKQQDTRSPCAIRVPNETCKPACKLSQPPRAGLCKVHCKGKCAQGLSEVPCNCSIYCPASSGYQPKPSPIIPRMADFNNGEDLCDCYPTCECESEASSSCICH